MKRHVAATLLVLTTLGILDAHLDIERQDGAYFLNVEGKKRDVAGMMRDQTNVWLRNCGSVTRVKTSSQLGLRALAAIQAYSPPDSREAGLVSLSKQDGWLIAEAEFANLNPAAILLQETPDSLDIADGAIWSGSAAPWKAGPLIRRYLGERAPAAPKDLLACFDPSSAAFE
jgi:hypothetical protein